MADQQIKPDTFRARLSHRQAQRPEITVEKTIDGLPFVLRRVPLDVMVAAGVVPESFYREMVKAQVAARDGQPDIGDNIKDFLRRTDDRTLATISLAGPALILAAVVSPKLVVGPATDEAVSLLELPESTQREIVTWIMEGCPDIPVTMATDDGNAKEVRRDNLSNFRPKQPGGKPFSLELDGDEISSVAV